MKWQYCRIARTMTALQQQSLVFEHYGLTAEYDFAGKGVPEIVAALLADGWEPLGGLEFKRPLRPIVDIFDVARAAAGET